MVWSFNIHLVISLSILLGSGLALAICLYELICEFWKGHQARQRINHRYVAIMLGLGGISLSGTVYGLVVTAAVAAVHFPS